MSGLETGRIKRSSPRGRRGPGGLRGRDTLLPAARNFGVPISQHQAIQLKLADMATKIQAARLLTYDAAAKKDAGERVDLESGMAKLFASEVCGEVTMEAMRVHGGYGFIKESPWSVTTGRSFDDYRGRHQRGNEVAHRKAASSPPRVPGLIQAIRPLSKHPEVSIGNWLGIYRDGQVS